ncbi:acetyltransferase [Sphingomonas arantia]|uniref:Acetyltransferase n=1 Tax=Sphingomonas arantia TaxID=1460676 RepID=A0ABW4TT56_9SPHN
MAVIIVSASTGQHAAVVYEAAILAGLPLAGYVTVTDGPPMSLLDCRWLGHLDAVLAADVASSHQFIVACGSNALRRSLTLSLQDAGASLAAVAHPAAILSPSAIIAPGSAILAGAIVGPRAVLGRGVIVNHAASVDHDCRLGDFAHIAPGARLAGSVQAGAGVFVGLNAAILPGIRIGADATIGAGAVVTRDVPPGTTVVGIPAGPR